jgi:hypothetical protein
VVRTVFWSRWIPPLALFQAAAGLVAFFLTYGLPATQDKVYPYFFHGVLTASFAATGALLVFGGRSDRRAWALGGFFLATATAFIHRPLRLAAEAKLGAPDLFAFTNAVELDCFMPFFLWTFGRDFPQPPASFVVRRRVRLAALASGAAGLLLLAANLGHFFATRLDPGGSWEMALAPLIPMRSQGIYYTVTMVPTAAAFLFLLWRARATREPDQVRVRLFLQALALAAAPALVEVLFSLVYAPYRGLAGRHPLVGRAIVSVLAGSVLLMPFLTPYAVLRYRVLDVRLIARRAIQYALARYTVIVLAAFPISALLVYLSANPDTSIRELFSAGRFPLLVTGVAVGIAALRYRATLLEQVDRRFFREQYDARHILTQLVERVRATPDVSALASLIGQEVDLALHLRVVALLVLEPRSGLLVDPRQRSRRLDLSSELVRRVSDAADPLTVDLENPRSPLHLLPERERHWLVDGGFKMIVPILGRDGSLVGVLGLGEKRSGLPFLREDRELLRAIAASAAWALELELARTPTPPWHGPSEIEPVIETEPDAVLQPAKECHQCNALYPPYTVLCAACSKRLDTAHVPWVLPGKFRFEKRIGIGGMGVVYRGTDLQLARHVAVKTLRRVSPEDALRLRREARTAAAVSHPHLAAVYGLETWQGTPLIVLELLEEGTLANRLQDGARLSARETVELGIAMASALARLHAADILHRDLKPSNIGFTRDGTPKLMDFGIARLMAGMRRIDPLHLEDEEEEELPPGLSPELRDAMAEPLTPISKPLVGTLSYLSPEALEGQPPDVTFDLWSLCIVLYECLLGGKVFSSTEPKQTMARIRLGRVPDFAQVCPDQPPVLAELFRGALHRSLARRPANAEELADRLKEVREELAGAEGRQA